MPKRKESGRIPFHYGFYAAMKVEYDLIHADVTYEQEIQLGEDPVRLDFLIIKKSADVVLNDPIGKFFKSVNIFEYKSPQDGLSIDDFFKAAGYTFIYKGYDRKVDELPIENMTLTLVRHSYPRELIKKLKQIGFEVNEEYPGIFRIYGRICVDVQLVVSSRLPDGEYEGLQLLASGCTKDNVLQYAARARNSMDENVKTNAGTVVGICLNINNDLGNELKEESTSTMTMTGAEVMDLIEKMYGKAFDELSSRALAKDRERVATDMLKNGEPIEKIVKYSRLAEGTIRNMAQTLGIAIM